MLGARGEADPVEGLAGERVPPRRRHSGVDEPEPDVLRRVEAVDEVEALEHEPDVMAAQPAQLGVVETADVLTCDPHDAGGRAVEGPDQVKQRRLPGAGGAHHGHELTRRDGEVDVAERVDGWFAVVGLGDVDQIDDVHGVTTVSPTRRSPVTCTNPPANVAGVTFTNWWVPARTRSTA